MQIDDKTEARQMESAVYGVNFFATSQQIYPLICFLFDHLASSPSQTEQSRKPLFEIFL